MIEPHQNPQTPVNSQETHPYMYLNENFYKMQSCLHSILKAKAKLETFRDLYECSSDIFDEVELKLNNAYSKLIDVIETHSVCNCSDNDSDDDDEVDSAN